MKKIISLEIENEEIVFADLTNRENLEVVAVCRSGNIFLIGLESREKLFLASSPFNSIPNLLTDFNPLKVLEDLSPDELTRLLENMPTEVESIESVAAKNKDLSSSLSLNAKLYSFKNYVCIVQDKGTSGVVLDISNPSFQKRLERGDYCANVTSFPISFYEKDNQTFLIHGTDWNRLDITCLETDESLTNRIVDYDTDSNYFDYFHSSLLVSPDAKHFTSNGWHWHPFGQIYCFSINEFRQNFELSHQEINVVEEFYYELDWDRPLCWIDNETLAIGFNKQICDESQKKSPSEILFFNICQNKIVSRIEFNGFGLTSEGNVFGDLFYDQTKKYFVGLNRKTGLLITDTYGNEIHKNPSFTSHKYSTKHDFSYQIDYKDHTIRLTY